MKTTCPHCGHKAEIADLVKGEVAKKWAYLLGLFPQTDLPTVQGFLDCFRKPGGVLQLSRQVNILAELRQIIESGQLDFERRIFEGISYPMVIMAMNETFRLKDQAGLPNLNYFKRILSAMVKQADAREERATEEARRSRPGRSAEPSRIMEAETGGMPDWVKEKMKRNFKKEREDHGD